MANIKVMYSSKTDHWATPKEIYKDFMENGYIDPCPLNCIRDNLNNDFGDVKMFINPPYSDVKSWVEFAIKHHKMYGNEIVFLVPARTDTKWFHRLYEYGVKIKFIKGRLKFNDTKQGAPFPSVYITLGKDVNKMKKEIKSLIKEYDYSFKLNTRMEDFELSLIFECFINDLDEVLKC